MLIVTVVLEMFTTKSGVGGVYSAMSLSIIQVQDDGNKFKIRV